jgi:hypothetical protein
VAACHRRHLSGDGGLAEAGQCCIDTESMFAGRLSKMISDDLDLVLDVDH